MPAPAAAAAPAPAPAAAAGVSSVAPLEAPSEPGKKKLSLALPIALVATAVIAGVGAYFVFFGNSGSSDLAVISERTGDRDSLYLAPLGSEERDLRAFANDSSFRPIALLGATAAAASAEQSAIVPVDGGAVVAWDEQDGEESETVVALVKPGEDEPKELYRERGFASVYLSPDGDQLLVERSSSGGSAGCFVGGLTEPLERVVRADSCSFHSSGKIMAFESSSSDTGPSRYSITMHDFAGKETAKFSTLGFPILSPNGGRLSAGTADSLTVFDANTGKKVAQVKGDEVTNLGWADSADSLLYAIKESGSAKLGVIGTSGTPAEILSGPSVAGELLPDGSAVIAATRTDAGVVTVSRVPSGSGSPVKIAEGSDVEFKVVATKEPKVVAWSLKTGEVWSGSATKGALTSAGTIRGLQFMNSATADFAGGPLYLVASVGSEDETSSQVLEIGPNKKLAPIGNTWDSARVESVQGDAALIVTTDGDDQLLLAVKGTKVEELDQAGLIQEPVFDGSNALYTSIDDPEAIEDAEILTASLDGSGQPEPLQTGAQLVARVVPSSQPVRLTSEDEGGEGSTNLWVDAGPRCTESPNIANQTKTGAIGAGKAFEIFCIAVPKDGTLLTVTVAANADTTLEVTDSSGSVASDDDSGDENNPLIETTLSEGIYDISLYRYGGSDSSAIQFSLTANLSEGSSGDTTSETGD